MAMELNDLCLYAAPFHGFEVLTISTSGEIITGQRFDPAANQEGLPTFLTCGIYSETSKGSSNLMCISNSSVVGMSGGPLLVNNGLGWEICGVLAGGPAVLGHRILYNVANHFKYGRKKEVKAALTTLATTGTWFGRFECELLLTIRRFGGLTMSKIQSAYRECLTWTYLPMSHEERLQKLNHNLAFSFLIFH
jgi:hypothetical protein